jgi:hypothetical protein
MMRRSRLIVGSKSKHLICRQAMNERHPPEKSAPSVVLTSKLDLRYPPNGPTRQLIIKLVRLTSFRFPASLIREIWRARTASVLFVSIPGSGELLLTSLIKAIYRDRIKTYAFDLIMREPGSIRERFFAETAAIDRYVHFHPQGNEWLRTCVSHPARQVRIRAVQGE